MVRLFAPLPELAPTEVELTGERRHYLLHVLRLEEGDALELFDGQGRGFEARVAQVTPDSVRVTLGTARVAPPRRELSVINGLPKCD